MDITTTVPGISDTLADMSLDKENYFSYDKLNKPIKNSSINLDI